MTKAVAALIGMLMAGHALSADLQWRGRMSTFGGPRDRSAAAGAGLAMWQPKDASNQRLAAVLLNGVGGLFHRLNPEARYVACRWSYSATPKAYLRRTDARVANPRTGASARAVVVDWGPARWTRRTADLSPGLARALGLKTDDVCVVTLPAPAGGR